VLLLVPLTACRSAAPGNVPTSVPATSSARTPSARISSAPTPSASARPTSPAPTTPAARSASPTSAAPATTPPPTTAPTIPPGPDQTLKTNSLYQIDLDDRVVSCRLKVRSPRPPVKNADLAPYLRTVVDCLVTAFAAPLAKEGFTLTAPKVKTYRKKITTPCGKYGQDVAPAYYCAATQTIYWPQTSDDGREAYTFARLGYVGLMAHEFGHHLQATTGMLNEYGRAYFGTDKKSTRYLLSRRLELQAQCFEGVFLATAAKEIKLSAKDRAQLREWHGYTGDEDPPDDRLPDHGTSKAQLRWLDRGLDSADFGRCNTWKASKSSVK
jgi:predicted metalloprotease